MWLRYLSIAMGVFTIIISYLAVRLVTRDPWTPVVAAGILAFIPRFIFLTAFVTNDALVVLLGATLMYASLRFTLSPSLARMVPLGAVFGLLVLTKLSALPMGLVIASAALLVAGWRRRLGLAALGAGVALVVSGWYLIQNTVRYGDPLAFRATKRYQTRINGLGNFNGQPYVVHDPLKYVFVKVPQQLVHSLWFQSGWGQFVWPSWVNWVVTFVVLVLIASLSWSQVDRRALMILGSLVIGGLLGVWMSAFSTGTFRGPLRNRWHASRSRFVSAGG